MSWLTDITDAIGITSRDDNVSVDAEITMQNDDNSRVQSRREVVDEDRLRSTSTALLRSNSMLVAGWLGVGIAIRDFFRDGDKEYGEEAQPRHSRDGYAEEAVGKPASIVDRIIGDDGAVSQGWDDGISVHGGIDSIAGEEKAKPHSIGERIFGGDNEAKPYKRDPDADNIEGALKRGFDGVDASVTDGLKGGTLCNGCGDEPKAPSVSPTEVRPGKGPELIDI